jgi:hypothetical protein
VHQMVVPLGLAVPQLIPRLFVIIHKVIVITSYYAIWGTVLDTGKLVLLPNILQAFLVSASY